MEIRAALPGDIEKIQELYQQLFLEMEILAPDYMQRARQEDGFLFQIIGSEASDILLAQQGETILGFTLLQELKTPPYGCIVPHRYCYLMDFVVHPDSRNMGAGSRLLRAAKAWGKARNLDYMELNVLSPNVQAIRLYEREGFSECVRTMRTNL